MFNQDIKTRIFVAETSPLSNLALFDAAYSLMPAERQEKIDKFRIDASKRLSLAAGLLLDYVLCQYGSSLAESEMVYNEHDKPMFKGNAIQFNLSHSGDYAICVVSDRGIGCDIEQIKPNNDKIAKRFFCESEYNDILSAPDDAAKMTLFYRYWTLKESFIKAIGTGLATPLSSFEMHLGDDISIEQNYNNEKYYFKEFDEISGYRIAVCSQNDCKDLQLEKIDLNTIIER